MATKAMRGRWHSGLHYLCAKDETAQAYIWAVVVG